MSPPIVGVGELAVVRSQSPCEGAVQVAASTSTFAACPSDLTWYQACRIFPFEPMRNVDRITPTVCLP